MATGLLSAGLLITQAVLFAEIVANNTTTPVPSLIAVVLTRALLTLIDSWIAQHCGAAAKTKLRQLAWQRLSQGHPDLLSEKRSAELVVVLGRGIDALDGFFTRYLTQLVLAAAVPVLLLTYLITKDSLSASIILVTIPMIPVFMVLIGKLTERKVHQQFQSLTMLAAHFADLMRGLTTLQVFNRAKAQTKAVYQTSEQLRTTTMSNLRMAFLSSFALELITTLGVALVAVSIGIRLLHGEVTFEIALIVLLLAPEVYLPLRQVGAQFHANVEGMSAAEKVFEIIEHPPPPSGPLRPQITDVSFNEVQFNFANNGQPVSFIIPHKQHVILRGPSGIGKSSLLNALIGFCTPNDGQIVINNTPLSEIDFQYLRSRTSWMSQHIFLENQSVESSFALHALGASHLVGRNTTELSAGERQLVALAQAISQDADLYLLDEPTAHLDEDTERAATVAIKELLRDKSALIITHSSAFQDNVVNLTPAVQNTGSVQ